MPKASQGFAVIPGFGICSIGSVVGGRGVGEQCIMAEMKCGEGYSSHGSQEGKKRKKGWSISPSFKDMSQ